MSSKFPTLAVEIIELISAFSDPADLRSLRLVCRELNRKTLHYFGLANFATVQTDLSRDSLQRIQNISESEHLAVHVQCLHIKHADDGRLGRGLDWCPHQWNSLTNQFGGADVLRDVLVKNLLKYRSFHINSYDEYQPHRETDSLIPSDALGIVMSLVAEADLALRSFTVESTHNGNGRLDTQRLQMPLSRTPRFTAAWSHIEELVLNFAMTSDQYDWILLLISSGPRLRNLSLVFHDASSSFIERLVSLHSLHRLEDLSLRSAHMTVENISTLLLNNRETLNSLSLRHTIIEDGGKWATVLETMEGQFPRLENLLLFWLKEQPANRRVVFSNLTRHPVVPGSEDYRPGDNRLRYDSHLLESMEMPIRLIYWGGGRRVVGVEYRGTGIDHVLSALADTAETV